MSVNVQRQEHNDGLTVADDSQDGGDGEVLHLDLLDCLTSKMLSAR